MVGVKKTKVEIYSIRDIKNRVWGDIKVESGQKKTSIHVASSYGKFLGTWEESRAGAMELVLGLSFEDTIKSLCGELGDIYIVDLANWKNETKRVILEHRFENYLTKEEAREAYNEMLFIISSNKDAEIIHEKLMSHNLFDKVFYDKESLPNSKKVKKHLFEFWQNIWTPFIKEIKKELH